jgi:hypothetical protein
VPTKTRSPRILSFDLESAGVNALRSDLGFIIVFGWKWLDEKKAHAITISKQGLRNFDDRQLLKQASKIIAQADLVVGHFASVFDRRFIQGRLLINNLPPIPPVKMRDTCMIARSVANFSSNRLKHLATILNMRHQKLENGWPDAWFNVMRGNMRALSAMADYCKGDVLAVEELYLRLRPFDNPHPRMVADRTRCGACGGAVEYRGYAYVGERKYRRYVCKACRKWGRETSCYKEAK